MLFVYFDGRKVQRAIAHPASVVEIYEQQLPEPPLWDSSRDLLPTDYLRRLFELHWDGKGAYWYEEVF